MCKVNYAVCVRLITPYSGLFYPIGAFDMKINGNYRFIFLKKILDKGLKIWYNLSDIVNCWFSWIGEIIMAADSKLKTLKEQGLLNSKPETVKDELFQKHDFFDACDLAQVKYEMIRRVEKENWTVIQASKTFGFSRPCFYDTKEALNKKGLPGLIPAQRGPKRPHKLSPDVMMFVENVMSKDETLRAGDIAGLIEKRFGFKIHPRSIERALEKGHKKKRKKK